MKFVTTISNLHYDASDQVPQPLRDTIRRLVGYGHDVDELARVFDLPVEWIRQYAGKPDPKNFQ